MRISDWSSDVCSSDLSPKLLCRLRQVAIECCNLRARLALTGQFDPVVTADTDHLFLDLQHAKSRGIALGLQAAQRRKPAFGKRQRLAQLGRLLCRHFGAGNRAGPLFDEGGWARAIGNATGRERVGREGVVLGLAGTYKKN